jgi:diaminopimelate epimerase
MTQISPTQRMTVLGTSGLYVNTGVPHFVIEQKPDTELSRRLRKVTDFGPPGANITFVQNLTNTSLEAVTFERGVEDYTQACGTGAVAAAMYLQNQKGPQNSIEVHMPGGVLKIENATAGSRPFLTGPVQIEFDMEIK